MEGEGPDSINTASNQATSIQARMQSKRFKHIHALAHKKPDPMSEVPTAHSAFTKKCLPPPTDTLIAELNELIDLVTMRVKGAEAKQGQQLQDEEIVDIVRDVMTDLTNDDSMSETTGQNSDSFEPCLSRLKTDSTLQAVVSSMLTLLLQQQSSRSACSAGLHPESGTLVRKRTDVVPFVEAITTHQEVDSLQHPLMEPSTSHDTESLPIRPDNEYSPLVETRQLMAHEDGIEQTVEELRAVIACADAERNDAGDDDSTILTTATELSWESQPTTLEIAFEEVLQLIESGMGLQTRHERSMPFDYDEEGTVGTGSVSYDDGQTLERSPPSLLSTFFDTSNMWKEEVMRDLGIACQSDPGQGNSGLGNMMASGEDFDDQSDIGNDAEARFTQVSDVCQCASNDPTNTTQYLFGLVGAVSRDVGELDVSTIVEMDETFEGTLGDDVTIDTYDFVATGCSSDAIQDNEVETLLLDYSDATKVYNDECNNNCNAEVMCGTHMDKKFVWPLSPLNPAKPPTTRLVLAHVPNLELLNKCAQPVDETFDSTLEDEPTLNSFVDDAPLAGISNVGTMNESFTREHSVGLIREGKGSVTDSSEEVHFASTSAPTMTIPFHAEKLAPPGAPNQLRIPVSKVMVESPSPSELKEGSGFEAVLLHVSQQHLISATSSLPVTNFLLNDSTEVVSDRLEIRVQDLNEGVHKTNSAVLGVAITSPHSEDVDLTRSAKVGYFGELMPSEKHISSEENHGCSRQDLSDMEARRRRRNHRKLQSVANERTRPGNIETPDGHVKQLPQTTCANISVTLDMTNLAEIKAPEPMTVTSIENLQPNCKCTRVVPPTANDQTKTIIMKSVELSEGPTWDFDHLFKPRSFDLYGLPETTNLEFFSADELSKENFHPTEELVPKIELEKPRKTTLTRPMRQIDI